MILSLTLFSMVALFLLILCIVCVLLWGLITDSFVGDAKSDLLGALGPILFLSCLSFSSTFPLFHALRGPSSVKYDGQSHKLFFGEEEVLCDSIKFYPEYIMFGIGITFFKDGKNNCLYSFISSYASWFYLLPIRFSYKYLNPDLSKVVKLIERINSGKK